MCVFGTVTGVSLHHSNFFAKFLINVNNTLIFPERQLIFYLTKGLKHKNVKSLDHITLSFRTTFFLFRSRVRFNVNFPVTHLPHHAVNVLRMSQICHLPNDKTLSLEKSVSCYRNENRRNQTVRSFIYSHLSICHFCLE